MDMPILVAVVVAACISIYYSYDSKQKKQKNK